MSHQKTWVHFKIVLFVVNDDEIVIPSTLFNKPSNKLNLFKKQFN